MNRSRYYLALAACLTFSFGCSSYSTDLTEKQVREIAEKFVETGGGRPGLQYENYHIGKIRYYPNKRRWAVFYDHKIHYTPG